jgi:NAD(P)-dependent dehydrogenase (short-subunit alcohol dehydrogenase family)
MQLVALVTGGSRGIGRAIADALAARSAAVAVVARGEEAVKRTAAELADRFGIRSLGIRADLALAADCAEAVTRCSAELGAPSVLVHNAGTAPSARLEDSDDAMLDAVLDLHVRAPFRLVRAALPGLRAGKSGTVVLLGSTAGLRGYPFTAAYTAAKHGMVGFARALAAEWAREPALRAFVVCPGFVDTDITRDAARAVAARGRKSADEVLSAFAAQNRLGRLHRPDEVADAVVRLVFDRPQGTVLDLDSPHPTLTP